MLREEQELQADERRVAATAGAALLILETCRAKVHRIGLIAGMAAVERHQDLRPGDLTLEELQRMQTETAEAIAVIASCVGRLEAEARRLVSEERDSALAAPNSR